VLKYRPDEVIFSQGAPCSEVNYIEEGLVKLTTVSNRGRGAVLGSSGQPCVSQFEEVVGGADEAPFAVDGGQATESELPVSEVGFDVAEDGFDAVSPFAIGVGVVRIGQLGVHGCSRYRRVGRFASHVSEHGVDSGCRDGEFVLGCAFGDLAAGQSFDDG